MKKKLPFLTRAACIALTLSVLVQLACLGLLWAGVLAEKNASLQLGRMLELLNTEIVLLAVSAAEPFFWEELFRRQAQGGRMLGSVFFLLLCLLGDVPSYSDRTQLLLYLVLPALSLLALLTAFRPLAFLCALGTAAAAVIRVRAVGTFSGFTDARSLLLLEAGEALYGAGLAMGLLGIRKPVKEEKE